jgi:hypothetical protein
VGRQRRRRFQIMVEEPPMLFPEAQVGLTSSLDTFVLLLERTAPHTNHSEPWAPVGGLCVVQVSVPGIYRGKR